MDSVRGFIPTFVGMKPLERIIHSWIVARAITDQ